VGLTALASAPSGFAAIALVDTLTSTSIVDGLSYTIDGSALDFTASTKLVVTIGSEGNSANGVLPAAIDSLTYGGITLSAAVVTGDTRSNVWYVDLAGTTAVGTNIQLEFVTGGETNRGYGLSAFTLSGTTSGVSSDGQSNGNATALTPPTTGEFIIGSFSRNNVAIVSSDPSLTIHSNDILEGQYSAASFYGTLGAAGLQTVNVGDMNSSGRTVIASFAAIPEPSAAALLGLGGLALILRRRR
jgi:hypothetical protein